MSPHMTGNDALILVILLCAPLAFGFCGALSIVALLFRGRVGRIAQALAIAGVILVHLILLASGTWTEIVFIRTPAPFFWMTPLGHALVVAGYFRVRALKRAGPLPT